MTYGDIFPSRFQFNRKNVNPKTEATVVFFLKIYKNIINSRRGIVQFHFQTEARKKCINYAYTIFFFCELYPQLF